jgi:hypothetical protein
MKTGRLLKFRHPAGNVQAYIYRDAGTYRAAIYLLAPGRGADAQPIHTISGADEAAVEAALREWISTQLARPR